MNKQEIKEYVEKHLALKNYSNIYNFFASISQRNIPDYEYGELVIQEVVEELIEIPQNMNSYSVCFDELINNSDKIKTIKDTIIFEIHKSLMICNYSEIHDIVKKYYSENKEELKKAIRFITGYTMDNDDDFEYYYNTIIHHLIENER